jgi:hypothetical protein
MKSDETTGNPVLSDSIENGLKISAFRMVKIKLI